MKTFLKCTLATPEQRLCSRLEQLKLTHMQQSELDSKISELNKFVEDAIKAHKPVYEGNPGELSYMISKVKNFGAKYTEFGSVVDNKLRTELGSLSENDKDREKTTSIYIEMMNNAISEFKKRYWD